MGDQRRLEGGVWEVAVAGNREACDHMILVQSISLYNTNFFKTLFSL